MYQTCLAHVIRSHDCIFLCMGYPADLHSKRMMFVPQTPLALSKHRLTHLVHE